MTPDPKVRSRPPQSASGKSGRIGNDKRTCTRWSNPHRKAAKLKRSTQATRPSHGSRAPLSKAKAEGCRNTEVRGQKGPDAFFRRKRARLLLAPVKSRFLGAGRISRVRAYPSGRRYVIRCGATMLMNSREVITLVFFQNLGKCLWLPVTR